MTPRLNLMLGLPMVAILAGCRTPEQRPDAELPGGASWFTGDVAADFTDATVVTVADPGGLDVGVPIAGGSAVSGNDIEYAALDYDPATDTLSVGIATYGVAGDVDGDGDGGSTSSWLSGLGGTDVADFGGTESFAVAFDLDEDGTLDVITGVNGLGGDTASFSVNAFAGTPFAPGFAFGSAISGHNGGLFASPSASAPHVEFSITSFSTLAADAGLTDSEDSFSVYVFMGSFSDAGIGEDFLPGVASFEQICFDDDGDGYTTCDNDCDDDDAAVNPDAEEVCDSVDNDCDGDTDEDDVCFEPTPEAEYCAYEAPVDSAVYGGGGGHAFWLPGIDTDLVFSPEGLYEQSDDATATLTGSLLSNSNPGAGFDVVVSFDGYTETAPSGSPKLELNGSAYVSGGGAVDPDSWTFYPDFSGQLIGTGDYTGAIIDITPVGAAFQVGEGANGKNTTLGASGWFNFTVLSQPPNDVWSDGQGDINIDLEDCEICTTFDLGAAAGTNIFVFEDYTGGLDVAGNVVACGDVELEAFAVGYATTGGDVLFANGNLVLSNGTVHGDAWWGASASVDDTVNFLNGGSAQWGLPVDCASEIAALTATSSDLADATATGTTTVSDWGQISLVGTDSSVNVFEVSGSDLSSATQLDISAPAGSVVVINIDGTAVSMENFGIFLDGVDETTIIYNFTEATSLTMGGIGIRGTILAPLADIAFDNGNFDGNIIANSLTGTAEGHLFLFDGGPFEICE